MSERNGAVHEAAVVDLTASPPGELVGTPTADDSATLSLAAISSSLDTSASLPDFLNSLLASNADPEPDLAQLDRTLHDLLTRLSILSQDTSSALEQSINDISRNVPRLTYDLQFMRESAATLHTSLGVVQSRMTRTTGGGGGAVPLAASTGIVDLSSPDDDNDQDGTRRTGTSDATKTYKSLDKLTHLDKLKTRMESARDVLREAESWSTLEGEITAFIASTGWDKAGARLSEASKSLVVFQSTPGEYESRKALLVSLQNELETALATALRAALDTAEDVDLGSVAHFAKVFRMMERGHEFKEYYFAARRQPVLDEWARFDGEGFAGVFLPRFFSVLLSTLTSESAKIGKLFNKNDADALTTLGDFLISTMDALSPSLGTRLSTMADSLGAQSLPELIKAFKATEDLEVAIHAVFDKTRSASPDTPALEVPTSASSSSALSSPLGRPPLPVKRSSGAAPSFQPSRLSTLLLQTSPAAWTASLFEPFLDLQTSYATLERRYLTHQLRNDPVLSSYRSGGKQAQALADRSATAFALAGEALGRNEAFTHGFGAKGMVDAVGAFLASFLDAQSDVIEPSKTSQTAAAASSRDTTDELDFGGIDYSTEDWAAFQSGLRTLKTCRDVGSKLSAFEVKVHDALAAAAAAATTTLSSSGGPPSASSSGAIALLQQSPLNSSELRGLLDSVQTQNSSSSSSSAAQPRFALEPARSSLADLTRLSQTSLQKIILSPLMSLLATYPSLSAWAQPDRAARRDGLVVPTFSLSPTDTVARITEGLLNLLRVFEGVGDDDEALGYSLGTLPFVEADTLRDMAAAAAAGESAGDDDDDDPLADQASARLPTGDTDEVALPPALVLSTWISSLSLTLLSHLTRTTLPSFRSLSTHGASQLAVDLAYLSNAVRALDVEWDELERWREAAELSKEDDWREALKSATNAAQPAASAAGGVGGDESARTGTPGGAEILRRIGRLRGWPSTPP